MRFAILENDEPIELRGVQALAVLGESHTTRRVTYLDGREEEESCEPYPVRDRIDMNRVAALIGDDETPEWTEKFIRTRYGLFPIEDSPVPEGKRIVDRGELLFDSQNNVVIQEFVLEDIPPPAPPRAPLTPEEKLVDAGMTLEDLRVLVQRVTKSAEIPESR